MRTSFVAGISLVLVLGCGTEETANPGTGTPGATGGNNNSSAKDTTATTKPSSTAKGGATGKGGTSSGQNAKGGTSESKGSDGGASDGGASDDDPTGGTGGKGSANPSTGGKVNNTATGGKSSTGNTTGGKLGVGGGKPVGGAGGAASGGAATGGKASGGSTGGTSSTKTSGGNTGGTVSSTTTTGSGNTTSASFKCDNLTAAAGSAGQAKPSGAAGGIKVLDWAGFKSAISYTFDDANQSQITNYQAMNSAGGKYTFFLWTSQSGASNSIWQTAVQDGHELGNHTSDHTQSNSNSGTTTAQSFIQSKFSVTAYAFAAPYGDASYQSVSSKFITNRSVAGNSSIGPGDTSKFSWLPADVPAQGAAASALGPIAGKWRVICIHGFTGDSAAYQPIGLDSFTSAVKSAISAGSWVSTVTNVATYQWGQNAMKAGGAKITWSKPAVFPANQCVRITTTGGTVKQKGAEVPWDDHGYYQISLDAGEVTVE